MVYFMTPSNRLIKTTKSYPVILFPVRLETKYVGDKLKIRIYPDDILINSHNSNLTSEEAIELDKYKNEFNEADNNDKKAEVFLGLTNSVGYERALYFHAIKENENEIEVREDNILTVPNINLLPDYFVVSHYKDGISKQIKCKSIPENLKVLFNNKGDNKGIFSNGKNWLNDYDEAVRNGMAITIPLETGDESFDKIIVTGIKHGYGANEAATYVNDLLSSHAYSKGLSLIEQGSVTNNTDESDSFFTSQKITLDEAKKLILSLENNLEDEQDNVKNVFFGLDLNAKILKLLDSPQERNKKYLNKNLRKAVWPALGDYLLSRMFLYKIPPQTRQRLYHYFCNHVNPDGAYPCIRVGKQPYGILPVSDMNTWKINLDDNINNSCLPDSEDYDNGFYEVLKELYQHWSKAADSADKIPRIGESGDEAEELLQILAMQPHPTDIRLRRVIDDKYLATIITLLQQYLFGSEEDEVRNALDEWYQQLEDSQLGAHKLIYDIITKPELNTILPNEIASLPIMKLFGWGADIDLSDGVGVVEDQSDNENPLGYLNTLTSENSIPNSGENDPLLLEILRRSIINQTFGVDADGRTETLIPIFSCKGLRQWIKLEQESATIKELHVKVGDVFLENKTLVTLTVPDHRIRRGGEVNIDSPFHALVTKVNTKNGKQVNQSDQLIQLQKIEFNAEDVYAAISDIAESSPAPKVLEQELNKVLSLCTNRLDAWFTGLVTRRLESMRSNENTKTGVFYGAYGYIENLEPAKKNVSELEGGYIHAPSTAQAAAAAVMRNAYLTHKEEGDAEAFRINLSSRRIRQAKFILQGVREGQELGELLGYLFERALHDNVLDKYIDDFRSLFPIIIEELAEAVQDTYVAPRNVVNGLSLLHEYNTYKETESNDIKERWLDKELDITNLDTDLIKSLQLIDDANDAVTDLLLYEGTYQAVQGNYDRAIAAIDTISGTGIPPETESVDTPVSGVTYTQRVAMLMTPPENPPTSKPRDIAEPAISQWVARRIGDFSQIGFRVNISNFEDEEGNPYTPVNINEANFDELDASPGIDEQKANNIIAYRNEWLAAHPDESVPFKNVKELTRVNEIDIETLPYLLNYVHVGGWQAYDLGTLDLGPLDFLYMCHTLPEALLNVLGVYDPNAKHMTSGETELERRIKFISRSDNLITNNCDIAIDFSLTNTGMEHGLDEAIELGRHLLDLVQKSQPLQPEALSIPGNDSSEILYEFNVDELSERVRNAHESILATQVRLNNPDENMIEVLTELSAYGINEAIPYSANQVLKNIKVETINKSIETRLTKFNAAKIEANSYLNPQDGVTTNKLKGIESLQQALKELFGNGFVAMPLLKPKQDVNQNLKDNFQQAIEQPNILANKTEQRIYEWMQQAAVTQQGVQRLETALMLSYAWSCKLIEDIELCNEDIDEAVPVHQLNVLQLPYDPQIPWMALSDIEFKEGLTDDENNSLNQRLEELGRPRSTASMLYITEGEIEFENSMSGFMLAEWSELIPDAECDTGVSFHYDGPNSQAPQSILLAVPADNADPESEWTEKELCDIVNSTMEMAKIRAVDIDALDLATSRFMPATILPLDAKNPEWMRDTELPGLEEILMGPSRKTIDFRNYNPGQDFNGVTQGVFTFNTKDDDKAEIKQALPEFPNNYLLIPNSFLEITFSESFNTVLFLIAKFYRHDRDESVGSVHFQVKNSAGDVVEKDSPPIPLGAGPILIKFEVADIRSVRLTTQEHLDGFALYAITVNQSDQ